MTSTNATEATHSSFQECVQTLNTHADYQVLQRLQARTQFNPATTPAKSHLLCVIDTETTGLDTEHCEIIELGYQLIEFDSNGQFYRVIASQNWLNEPQAPITKEVTQVTGLTDADVKGQHINWTEVEQQLQDVTLFVAHNAAFDRPVLERYSEVFVPKIWGCSVSQIDWLAQAHVGSKSQEFLCWKIGQFFYDAHRALDDVQALSQLLACPIGNSQTTAFSHLLKAVRQSKSLVKATGAPFEVKDHLKSRGYRWNGAEKVWQKVLEDANLADELAWLAEQQTPNPNVIKLKATDTFSVRAK